MERDFFSVYKQVLKLLVVKITIMKLQSILLTTAAASVVAFGGIATLSQSSLAQKDNRVYSCEKSPNNIPTTYALTKDGIRISFISWRKSWSDEYTPERRCQIVSQRFEKAEKEGDLNYLASRVVNNQNVICAARRKGGPCQQDLFSLRSGDKPDDVIEALLGIASQGRGGPLEQTENGSSRNYYNVDFIFRKKSTSTTE